MHVPYWLCSLVALLTPAPSRRTPRRQAFRPRIEVLEDRITPTTVQITDPALSFASGPRPYLTPVESTLYFLADGGANGPQLWRTDGRPGDAAAIAAEMNKITESREATQPVKSRTGGSTFKNPPGHKAWQLVDAAGCRGLRIGDAQVSEMHCNFLINLGNATAAEIETLGETVRELVKKASGVELAW